MSDSTIPFNSDVPALSPTKKRKSSGDTYQPCKMIMLEDRSSPLDDRLSEIFNCIDTQPEKEESSENTPPATYKERMLYRALFQLHTILAQHDDNGRPNLVVRNAEDKDWKTDKKLKKYSRHVKESKKLHPFIKASLKRIEKKQSPK